jgi:hypothetical protein
MVFLAVSAISGAAPDRARFVLPETPDYETTEGTAHLAWKAGDHEIGASNLGFEVQRSSDSAFSQAESYYEGTENGTFVSGLPGGEFFFRVRAIDPDGVAGGWSPSLRVNVRYPSPTLVKTLMTMGAIVFCCTVVVVITGHRKTVRETAEKTTT